MFFMPWTFVGNQTNQYKQGYFFAKNSTTAWLNYFALSMLTKCAAPGMTTFFAPGIPLAQLS